MHKSLIYGLLPLLLACHKGDQEPTKTPTKQPQPTAQPKETPPRLEDISTTKNNPTKGISQEAQALFQYSPTSPEFALFVDFSVAKQGPIWKRYGQNLEDQLKAQPSYQDFVKRANWDPLQYTSYAYISFTHLEAEPRAVMVLKIKNGKTFQDAIVKDPTTRKVKYQNYTLYTDTAADFFFCFPSEDLLVAGDPQEIKEALSNTQTPQGQMQEMLSRADASAGAFGAFVFSEAQRQDLAQALPVLNGLSGFYFTLDARTGFDTFGGAHFSSKSEATNAKLMLDLGWSAQQDQWEATGLWKFLSLVTFKVEQSDLVFSWKLDESQALAFVEQLTTAAQPTPTATITPVPERLSPFNGPKITRHKHNLNQPY